MLITLGPTADEDLSVVAAPDEKIVRSEVVPLVDDECVQDSLTVVIAH